ncbi:hypothetical protein WJX79_000755 [Trebouxia sp. C0005]
MRSRQARYTNAQASNHGILDVANHLSSFVKQQKKRTLEQDAKQQWRLNAAKLSSSSSKLESALPRLHDEVQLLCQQHQTAADDTRQRLEAEGADLHASFVQRLQDCQEDLRSHDLSPYAREHSDWTQQDQELLFQISQQFKADSLAPSKDSMHQYMQAMLPGKSIVDIAGHATWCWQKCMLDKRSKSLFCAWDKARKTQVPRTAA